MSVTSLLFDKAVIRWAAPLTPFNTFPSQSIESSSQNQVNHFSRGKAWQEATETQIVNKETKMRFRDAKKLHNGDEVTVKETNSENPARSLWVISVEIEDKDVFIHCDDGGTYHHTEVS